MLLGEGDQVEKRVSLPERLTAPVEEGAVIGSVEYFLEGVLLKKYPVVAKADVGALNFSWMVNFVWKLYAL